MNTTHSRQQWAGMKCGPGPARTSGLKRQKIQKPDGVERPSPVRPNTSHYPLVFPREPILAANVRMGNDGRLFGAAVVAEVKMETPTRSPGLFGMAAGKGEPPECILKPSFGTAARTSTVPASDVSSSAKNQQSRARLSIPQIPFTRPEAK